MHPFETRADVPAPVFVGELKSVLARAAAIAIAGFVLAGCGGGGGGASAESGAGNTDSPVSGLQAHLSACPTTQRINEDMACMQGQYRGKTTDGNADCTFNYGDDGAAYYTAGGQTLSTARTATSAATVFQKKPAGNAAGFEISWALGIATGDAMKLWYGAAQEPASAGGLLVRPESAAMPACLITQGPQPVATGASSTANLLGRAWQGPQTVNGANGAVAVSAGKPMFEAGLADDGRAFIAFRQSDASGRPAVHVVDGRPNAAGQAPSWSSPQVLDADAPLLAGNFRPRLAVSGTGHAVVAWLTERPCEADAYESSPTGKTCRYVYASRRLVTDSAWEPARRVHASPPTNSQDVLPRINARGDVTLTSIGFYFSLPGDTMYSLTNSVSTRLVTQPGYTRANIASFWTNASSTRAYEDGMKFALDDLGNLFVAGQAAGPFDLAWLQTTLSLVQTLPNNAASSAIGAEVFELSAGNNGFAAFTWRGAEGSRDKPPRLTLYSPASQQWLPAFDTTAFTQWGSTALAATSHPEGEFLLYSGCKLTVLRGSSWEATRDLPAYCGRDQAGGLYAFNRKGDYLGINWAGKPGQWGYYSYAQNKLLKGAPGTAAATSADFVLGVNSNAFGAQPAQLLLSANGQALAVTTSTYTTLPSAENPAGVDGGAAAKLWAVYLK